MSGGRGEGGPRVLAPRRLLTRALLAFRGLAEFAARSALVAGALPLLLLLLLLLLFLLLVMVMLVMVMRLHGGSVRLHGPFVEVGNVK